MNMSFYEQRSDFITNDFADIFQKEWYANAMFSSLPDGVPLADGVLQYDKARTLDNVNFVRFFLSHV